MLSKRLYFFFTMGAVVVALLVTFVLPRKEAWVVLFMIPFVVGFMISYVMSNQIDWWWYQKHPPELPGNLSVILLQHFTFYQHLSAANKKRFRQRVAMYMEARGFVARRGPEESDVPPDIKMMIAANVVMLTFGQPDFILDPFERIFIYIQAFPSPQYPNHVHASEIEEEDACFLFSGEHIMLSFKKPEQYYNVVIHEFARAFQITQADKVFPDFKDTEWEGYSREAISKYINLPEVNPLGVSVNYFFSYPEKFQATQPNNFERYKQIFNIDPFNISDPVIDKSLVVGMP